MSSSSTVRSAFALALLTILATGCSYSINLITERRSLDRYAQMQVQARQHMAQQEAFLDEANQQTDDADQAPYPQLGDQVEAMKRALAAETEDQSRIDAFKPRYDAFAAGRVQISSDDKESMAAHQAVMSDYGAIGQAIDADLAQFNQASQGFNNLCQQYHVEKVVPADLIADLDDFSVKSHDALNAMQEQVASNRKTLEFGRHNGLSEELLRHKGEVVEKMNGLVAQARPLKAALDASSGVLRHALRGSAPLWSGPGMPSGIGKSIWDLKISRDQFWKDKQAFDALGTDFDKVEERHAEEPRHDKAP